MYNTKYASLYSKYSFNPRSITYNLRKEEATNYFTRLLLIEQNSHSNNDSPERNRVRVFFQAILPSAQ